MSHNKKRKPKKHAFAHIRNTWTIHPATQVKESKKIYTRKVKHKKGRLFDHANDVLLNLFPSICEMRYP